MRFRHWSLGRVLLAAAVTAVATPALAEPCGDAKGPSGVTLAPPFKAVDVCQQDPILCRRLIAEFPAKESIAGFFVTPEEWATYTDTRREFDWYFIAFGRKDMNASEVRRVTALLESMKGDVPAFPGTRPDQTVHPYGLLDRTDSSVSYGAVLTLPYVPGRPDALLAANHTLLVIKEQVLSLYSFARVRRPEHIDELHRLAAEWRSCVARANDAAK